MLALNASSCHHNGLEICLPTKGSATGVHGLPSRTLFFSIQGCWNHVQDFAFAASLLLARTAIIINPLETSQKTIRAADLQLPKYAYL